MADFWMADSRMCQTHPKNIEGAPSATSTHVFFPLSL